MSFLKNFEPGNLLVIVPIYLVLNFIISFVWLFQGKSKHFAALYQSIWWNIVHYRQTMRKRKIIQAGRKKSDKQLFKFLKKNPGLSYYYYIFKGELEKYNDKEI